MEIKVQIKRIKSGYCIVVKNNKNEIIREMFQEYIPNLKDKTHHHLIKQTIEILAHFNLL